MPLKLRHSSAAIAANKPSGFGKGFDRGTVFINDSGQNTKNLAPYFSDILGCHHISDSCGVSGLCAIPV
jgi:hypothetical protein